MQARITDRPDTFARVDQVKISVGQVPLAGDNCIWILGGPLVVLIDNETFTVPRGFTTDGASIPDVAQWLTGWNPWEPPQRWAAILHDWLYTQPGTLKHFADLAFRAVLDSEGANWWQRTAMYWAVHWFGLSAYDQDQLSGPMIYP